MDWHSRIRSALSGPGVSPEDDVLEELAQHAAAMYATARANGRTAEAAARAVEEQIAVWSRDARFFTRRPQRLPAVPPPATDSAWTGLAHDVLYAVRMLRRQPGYALTAALTMAVGIGVTTLLFSVTWGVLMKPLPWPHADRIIVLKETRGGNPPRFNSFSNAAYLAWREHARTIEDVAAWSHRTATISGVGDPERVRVAAASASLFTVLGVRPLIGSVFTEEGEGSQVIVLSEPLWRTRFGADPSVLGRALRLDGEAYTVIGVLPGIVAYPNSQTRAWIPFRVPTATGNHLSLFEAIALLRPGTTPKHAAAEGTARGAFVPDTGLTTTAVFGGTGPVEVSAQPLRAAITRDVRSPLLVLLAAVGLLLLTATANVASVQLARATTRRREIAIRAAIGAGTARLARQLLVETLLIGFAGGSVGLAFAWLLHGAVPVLLPADFPRMEDVNITLAVLLFATAVSVATSIVIGVLPALSVRRLDLVDALAEHGAVSPVSYRRRRLARSRRLIIAGQVAIACVLLVGASLLGRSFVALLHADRGYDPSNVLTARLSFGAAYAPERRYALVDTILSRLDAIPGIVAAAFTSEAPLTPGGSTVAFTVQPQAGGGPVFVQASPRIVSPRCFSALGIRIAEGRGFTESDAQHSPPVVIVNRAFLRRYLGQSALGTKLPMAAGYGNEHVQATVIGIAEDVRYPTAAQSTQPEIYYSFRQMDRKLTVPVVTLLVRTSGDPRAVTSALRGAIRNADANLVPDAVLTLEDRISTSVARPRLYAVLLGGFAVFALGVAGVGLFGVLSYSVAQRSRELGVRAALGATPSAIVRMVIVDGLAMTAAGVAIGLGAAIVLVRSLGTLLYGVTPFDGVTFAVVPVLLGAVGALACFVPARRAARVDPLKVLKGL